LLAALDAMPASGSLQTVLRSSLRDETVEVEYWLPGLEEYVDAAGRPSSAGSESAHTTMIVRSGVPVAVVRHDGAHLAAELEAHIGPAARLAVDNERLRAGLLAQLAETERSRARIVEAADDARHRIERNLHDGLQQRLLGLSFEVRLAAAEARRMGATAVVTTLDAVAKEVQLGIDELRTLARGIFPAVLADAGLPAAVRAVAEDAPLPVRVAGEVTRLPNPVEMAAYVAVIDVLDRLGTQPASFAAVRLDQTGGDLVVVVGHDASPGAVRDLGRACDRVAALGGSIDVEEGRVSVVIPCASS
jgi:signal transduction histidine kinase